MSSKSLPILLGSVPGEVVLSNPPLKLALAQVRFPIILPISQPNAPQVASFQESIRDDYPIYQEQNNISFSMVMDNVEQSPQLAGQSQIFHTLKSEDGWDIVLNRDAVSLSTTKYRTKEEFVDRFSKIVEAVQSNFNPNKVTRLGVRFIDRVEDDAVLKNLNKYINPAFLGLFPDITQSSLMQSLLTIDKKTSMNLKWGLFDPNQPIPGVNIHPHPNVSWVLDSDIFVENFTSFDPNEITSITRDFSGSAYAMFRHVFNNNFIRFCGGKI